MKHAFQNVLDDTDRRPAAHRTLHGATASLTLIGDTE